MNKRHAYFSSALKTRAENDGKKTIEGYFSIFNQATELWADTFEIISRNAFDNSLRNNDIRCLFNHDSGTVLGRNKSGTLKLNADDYGLYGEVAVNENDSQAMDIYARIQRGDISGCSFGFVPKKETSKIEGSKIIWTVEDADVFEVSICTFPAYPQTEIKARQDILVQTKTQKIERQRAALKKKLEDIKC